MINEIKKKFNNEKEIMIIYGNWQEGEHMKKFVATPNKKMEKILKQNFKFIKIDEYKTSKICNKCKVDTKKHKLVKRRCIECKTINNKNEIKCKKCGKEKIEAKNISIHGLLCCKNKKCSKLWNRDINGCKNMIEIVRAYIRGENRPEIFTRKVV